MRPSRDRRHRFPCRRNPACCASPGRRHVRGIWRQSGSRPRRSAGPRGGSSSSTPPRGAKHSRVNAAKFRGPDFLSLTASRRMMRTSSSIERLCSAARTRRRVFTSSSRLRIVMLAMSHVPYCDHGSVKLAHDCSASNTTAPASCPRLRRRTTATTVDADQTERKTAHDFAQCAHELAEAHYREAETMRVVLYNLSAHKPAAPEVRDAETQHTP